MSKWHVVKVPDSDELRKIILYNLNQYKIDERIEGRSKFMRYRDVYGKWWAVGKFKDEIAAMAFKLRWL